VGPSSSGLGQSLAAPLPPGSGQIVAVCLIRREPDSNTSAMRAARKPGPWGPGPSVRFGGRYACVKKPAPPVCCRRRGPRGAGLAFQEQREMSSGRSRDGGAFLVPGSGDSHRHRLRTHASRIHIRGQRESPSPPSCVIYTAGPLAVGPLAYGWHRDPWHPHASSGSKETRAPATGHAGPGDVGR